MTQAATSRPTYTPRAMLERLVAFDTTSRRTNLELIEFVENYLDAYGVPHWRAGSADGQKTNLCASVGPNGPGGIVLSGHSDVVPVDGQPWSTDPWRLTERDGKLFARGTCDMKAFLAIGLALLPKMLERPLKRPFHFAISYDEEVGCAGVGSMIDRMVQTLPPVHAVIVGEPSDMGIVNAHKGITSHYVRIRGHEAHSSQPQRGANANMAAGLLIAKLQQMAAEREANPIPGSRYEPPYTSFNVGELHGGTALNIIPLDCWFSFEYRMHPGDDHDGILAEFTRYAKDVVEPWLKRFRADASITIQPRAKVPPLLPEDDGPAEALVRHLTGSNATGAVSYATEGGLFQHAGYSTVICGPGSIDQAHQPDEFISIEQFELGTKFQQRLIEWAQT
ncbi:MAG TPA: acetylornithine deacetylase [Kiloniellales bacterium]|nr:acetylornithine deacetylase [Kiloniellales bacterium]